MNILKMLGLMTVKEHEAVGRSNATLLQVLAIKKTDMDAADAAIENLIKQRDDLVFGLSETRMECLNWRGQALSNETDAELWRAKKAKDADYEKNRRVRKK